MGLSIYVIEEEAENRERKKWEEKRQREETNKMLLQQTLKILNQVIKQNNKLKSILKAFKMHPAEQNPHASVRYSLCSGVPQCTETLLSCMWFSLSCFYSFLVFTLDLLRPLTIFWSEDAVVDNTTKIISFYNYPITLNSGHLCYLFSMS